MLKHGEVLALDHALHKGARRVGRGVVLALVAHTPHAFYLFVKAPEPDANAFCERAKALELLLVPSNDFGCEGYVRISYCVSYDMIKRSLPAFEKLIAQYRK